MNSIKKLIYPVLLILIVTIVSIFGGYNSPTLKFEDDYLVTELPDVFSYSVPYESIVSLHLQEMPEEGEIISGGKKRSTHYGLRRNQEWEDYTICTTEKSEKCMVVETTDGTFVISYESTSSTEALYDAFCDFLTEGKYQAIFD